MRPDPTLRAAAAAIAVALALVPSLAAQQAGAPPADASAERSDPTCVACHADPGRLPEPAARAPVEHLAEDAHGRVGLSCHDCHGGDPDVPLDADGAAARAHAPAAGFVGAPDPMDVPSFCGRCHSDPDYMATFDPGARVDQEARYLTSHHGQLLAEGDTDVAHCLSCHGRTPDGGGEPTAHGILAAGDPRSPVFPTRVADTCGRCHADPERMSASGLPTDQLERYLGSVHHRQLVQEEDLSAPTCNDCHGNHGARPPHVESVVFVCGTCHGRQASLFRESSMAFAFEMMELNECLVCHEHHGTSAPSDEMLAHGPVPESPEPGSCHDCHADADDPALEASERMHGAITGLAADLEDARAVVDEAARKGMPVGEAEYVLASATDALIESRVLIHGWAAEPVVEACTRGQEAVDEAAIIGAAAIEEYHFRHRWLGLSLFGIAAVIVSLILKVRQVDRRWRASLAETGPPSA